MQDAGGKTKLVLLLILVVCLALVVPVRGEAQVTSNYDLSWHVFAGGSRQMQSASYVMMGTVGQPLARPMGSSRHSLGSSFWSGAAAEYRVYLPIVVRNWS